MKSFMASPATIERKLYVVDATVYTLGRLSSEVAKVLRGKNKPIFTPHFCKAEIKAFPGCGIKGSEQRTEPGKE